MRQFESFFWGIIAALGALFVQLMIFIGFMTFNNPAANTSFSALYLLPQFIILSALIEESFKYLIIAKRIELYSLEKSYVVNSLLVGLGFAATELWLLSSQATLPSPQILSELAIIHIGTAGLIGYLVATKNPKKFSTFLGAITLVTFFHAGYNFLIQKRGLAENYLILALLGFLIAINLINLLRISRKLAQD
jgi:hypothetical protein